jgi:hypothetical protein
MCLRLKAVRRDARRDENAVARWHVVLAAQLSWPDVTAITAAFENAQIVTLDTAAARA